jgi:hypothetical protein
VNRVSNPDRVHKKAPAAVVNGGLILAACFASASEARREAAPRWCHRANLGRFARKIVAHRQLMHRRSTVLAQVFHR